VAVDKRSDAGSSGGGDRVRMLSCVFRGRGLSRPASRDHCSGDGMGSLNTHYEACSDLPIFEPAI
jgi:hypothetical protein